MDFYPTLWKWPVRRSSPAPRRGFTCSLFKGDEFQGQPLLLAFPHYQGEGSIQQVPYVGQLQADKNYHHGDYLLFDLLADPEEENNKATEKPGWKMHTELMEHLKISGATIPKPLKKKKKKK